MAGKACRVKVAWLCLLSYQNEMQPFKGRTLPSSFITAFLRATPAFKRYSPLLSLSLILARIREIAAHLSVQRRFRLQWKLCGMIRTSMIRRPIPSSSSSLLFIYMNWKRIFKLPFWTFSRQFSFFLSLRSFLKQILLENCDLKPRGRREKGEGRARWVVSRAGWRNID